MAVRTIVDGLGFPEAPRWHESLLWMSDMATHEILAMTADGEARHQWSTPFAPSGLGWLADGTLLVVAMHERAVMRQDGDAFVVHADIAPLLQSDANDMVTAQDGTSYVSSFGYDPATEEKRPTHLVKVDPDGGTEAQPGSLFRPNGMAITPDGGTLYVAETRVHRLMAFSIGERGRLEAPRLVADLPSGTWADGICLDEAGAVWVADPKGHAVRRVLPDGSLAEVIEVPGRASVACVLGGVDRATLFIASSALGDMAARAVDRAGRIDAVEVDVPGAGRP